MQASTERDICLGFEELEPCCQKEILMQRKEMEFRKRIKEFDRSCTRNDTRDEVFTKIETLSHCHCCLSSRDYPLLKSLREGQCSTPQVSKDFSEDDDSDFDDDYVSPQDALRLEQVKTNVLRSDNFHLLGYGLHVEDSAQHLIASLESVNGPAVIHLVDPNVNLCGYMDLALETISQKYMGCRFRRIMLRDSFPLLEYLKISELHEPSLLCWKDKELLDCINIRRHFDTGCDVIARHDVETYLDRLRVLAVDNPEIQLIKCKVLETDLFDRDCLDEQQGDGSRRDSLYCDHKECDKAYPHTHVAGAGKGGGGSLLGGHNSDGADVFEKNHFFKF